ncbi:hypothetical protein BSKO_06232 [Bryopsis sp. KO-2023]|nr:hypothetical protein BSKO_06232 [Bryopsis sp. KO-2023]
MLLALFLLANAGSNPFRGTQQSKPASQESLGNAFLGDGGGAKPRKLLITTAIIATKAFIHPKWTGNVSLGFDIALLLLRQPSSKAPVSLPEKALKISKNKNLVTLGWGTEEVSGNFSSVLRQAPELRIFPLEKCKQLWEGSINDEMICAAPTKVSKCQRVCEGDSGGPLVLPSKNSPKSKSDKTDVLLGITTFSPDYCGQNESLPFQPDVFSSVLSVIDWIHNVTSSSKPSKNAGANSCGEICSTMCESLRSTDRCKLACQSVRI